MSGERERSDLQGGVEVASVAHVEHPRARPTLAGPVANLHLISPEQSLPRLRHLVQLDHAGAARHRLVGGVTALRPGEDDVLLLLLLRQAGALPHCVIVLHLQPVSESLRDKNKPEKMSICD